MTIRIGLVGVGKIARDQHIPAIRQTPAFELVATADPNTHAEGVRSFRTIEEMLRSVDLDAVSLCMPPQWRYDAALAAIAAGKHVLLEKPPGATLSEVEDLRDRATTKGVTLFASWHSRYAPAVAPAAEWLVGKTIRSAAIVWKEDVRYWHPGQAWIWQPGGTGVFDPGINALSIATRLLPAFRLIAATLAFPSNCATPIAADLRFLTGDGAPVTADFDFCQTGEQTWDILIETDRGSLKLSKGGSEMAVDGATVALDARAEYPALYAHFAELVAARRSDVDLSPLRHVADAFMLGERKTVEAFYD